MKNMLFIAFISLFYAIGLAILGYGLWSARRSTVAANWPVARGVIQSCTLETSSDSDGTTYHVKVLYNYSVNQKQYTGTRVAFGYTGSSGHKAHQEIYDKIQNAKSIDVRYDPASPSVSTLSFGIHRSIKFLLIFAITWLAFIVGFTVMWWMFSRTDDTLMRNLVVY